MREITVQGNKDTGSLKIGTLLKAEIGDVLLLNGKEFKVSFIMGKEEKTSLCFKGCGKVPIGDVSVQVKK